jgi:hypothetical protein
MGSKWKSVLIKRACGSGLVGISIRRHFEGENSMKRMVIRFAAGRRFAIAGFVSFRGSVKSHHCAVALQRAVCLLALFCWGSSLRGQAPAGKTRTYYVAADEVNWDYAPTGRDEAMGHPFDALQKGYTESGPHQIGRVYRTTLSRS